MVRLLVPFVAAVLLAALPSGPVWAAGPEGLPPSVRIKPLLLPVVSPRGDVEKYTQIEVTLEVADAIKLGEVQLAIPRLHDAILTELYLAIDAGWIVRGNIANAPALRKQLADASGKLVGANVISRVLITPVARQSAWP